MNSNQRSNLELSESQFESFSDNTILEELQEKLDESNSSKYVLIKHDYYSSDSDHGRELLRSFLQKLCESSFKSIIVYLIDEGTLLLDESNPLHNDIQQLIDRSELIFADKEIIEQNQIRCLETAKFVLLNSGSIAEEIIYLSDLLILE